MDLFPIHWCLLSEISLHAKWSEPVLDTRWASGLPTSNFSTPQTRHCFMSYFPSGGIKPAAFLLINAVICPPRYVCTSKSSFQTNTVQPLSRMITKRGLFSASQLLYSHWHNIKFHYAEFFIPFVTSQVPFLSTFGVWTSSELLRTSSPPAPQPVTLLWIALDKKKNDIHSF